MPFIVLIKKENKYRLFGSLPILCKTLGFDDKKNESLGYKFSQKKLLEVDEDDFLIIRVSLERGGSSKV